MSRDVAMMAFFFMFLLCFGMGGYIILGPVAALIWIGIWSLWIALEINKGKHQPPAKRGE